MHRLLAAERPRWWPAPLMLGAGALLAAAFPPTGFWLGLLALVPLFVLAAESRNRRAAFGLGFFFGVGFFALHLFWLPNSLSSPELFGPVGWIIYPPLVLIEGAFWGIVTFASRALGGRGAGTLLVLPGWWLVMEWARTQGPLAFPWGSLGYVWLGTPLAQAADLVGSYGLSLLALALSALLALAFQRRGVRRVQALSAALGLALCAFGYGQYRLTQTPPLPDRQALLVQGNTDPLGRAQGLSDDLSVYTALTAAATRNQAVDLVIWPEGAVLSEPLEGARGEATRLRVQESALGAAVITGAGVWEWGGSGYRRFNSAYGLSQGRLTGRYDKVYLVPFGEGIPFAGPLQGVYAQVYGWFGLGPSSGTPGRTLAPIEVPGLVAAVYICYESVFPQVAREMVRAGAEVLVNISNDAWFGRGQGAEQHFGMGNLRAIETRRYLLRAGNDGVTAVVGPRGDTLQRLERHVAGTLLGDYARMTGKTFYVRYGHLLVPLVALLTLAASATIALRRRARLEALEASGPTAPDSLR